MPATPNHLTWICAPALCGALVASCGDSEPEPGSQVSADLRGSLRATEGEVGTTPNLHFVDPEVDFGELIKGEKRSHSFLLRNRGDQAVRIRRVKPTCGCTLTRLETEEGDAIAPVADGRIAALITLEPGEACRVALEFNSWEQAFGPQEKAIEVHSDDPLRPIGLLRIRALVLNAFHREPATVQFGSLRRGAREERLIRVTSDRLADFELKGFDDVPGFLAVHSEPLADQTGWQIRVELLDSAPVGPLKAVLRARLGRRDIRPFEILVDGRIESPIRFDTGNPDNREKLDFGVVRAGTEVIEEITIFNEDPAVAYQIQSIEIDSKQSQLFRSEVIQGEAAGTQRIRITLDSKAGARRLYGKVRILTTHPDLPEKLIPFFGWIDTRTDNQ